MSPGSPPADTTEGTHKRRRQVRVAQIDLLYANANVGVGITVAAASILGSLQWQVIPHPLVLGWLVYMVVVSSARFGLGRLYRRTIAVRRTSPWATAFAVGAGLSGAGWGVAAVLLYPEAHLVNQVFLAFVLGGMMLGAVSLLAPRPEAFLAFIVPTGVLAALRLLLERDDLHVAMGLLAAIFTADILITTWRIYLTVSSSLHLRYDNQDLLADLQKAKEETEALNHQLELRVEERTLELQQTNERLRAEIEQRKQAEDDLLRARKLESLGVLAGGIAHDFNNLLTIVQGNIGLAQIELEPENPVHDILGQAAGACQRAASLASQLLTFGKGGAPVRRIVSATAMITDTVGLVRAGSNVRIDLAIADDLWPANIDASQIGHALHNILLNARQAMPDGGLIEVRAENVFYEAGTLSLSRGTYVRISVRDHGCGIPPNVLPRVFDPYFTTKQTGKGLGLAAAYAIVAQHQGCITVQSTVGVETTFSMFLPASEQSLTPEAPHGGVLRAGSGRILVMDDEDALRKLLARMLEQLGYEVECAADGAAAAELFEAARASSRAFDAVLLDLTVPGGMGGKDTAIRLREIDPQVPLIVSSGYSDAPILSDFRRHGFDAVLRKPWSVAELSEVFSQVIRTARQGGRGLPPHGSQSSR